MIEPGFLPDERINADLLPARGESPIQTVQKHLAQADAVSAFRDVGRLEPCPGCRVRWSVGGRPCDRCRRLTNIGRIAEILWNDFRYRINRTDFLDGLDALATVLRDHAITAREHRRELREAEQDAQQGARDAYSNGTQDERERNAAW